MLGCDTNVTAVGFCCTGEYSWIWYQPVDIRDPYWDIVLGALRARPGNGHGVASVAFLGGRGSNDSPERTLTTLRHPPILFRDSCGSTPEFYVCSGHEGAITAGCFSPDGKHIASAASDRTTRVWSAADGMLLATLTEQHTSPLVWTTSVQNHHS